MNLILITVSIPALIMIGLIIIVIYRLNIQELQIDGLKKKYFPMKPNYSGAMQKDLSDVLALYDREQIIEIFSRFIEKTDTRESGKYLITYEGKLIYVQHLIEGKPIDLTN